jgi:hypothetical protein
LRNIGRSNFGLFAQPLQRGLPLIGLTRRRAHHHIGGAVDIAFGKTIGDARSLHRIPRLKANRQNVALFLLIDRQSFEQRADRRLHRAGLSDLILAAAQTGGHELRIVLQPIGLHHAPRNIARADRGNFGAEQGLVERPVPSSPSGATTSGRLGVMRSRATA